MMMNFMHTFDYSILKFWHDFAVMTHGALTPLIRAISYSFDLEKGLPLVIIVAILILFKKTRKAGIVMLLGILIGLIFTNLAIKNTVARLRPYQSGVKEYLDWWKYVGSVKVKEYSFPSGHATASMAAMTGLFLTCNKKWSWLGFVFVLMVGISRNYLVVHYPTDVAAGVMIGFVAACLAYALLNLSGRFVKAHLDNKWCKKINDSGLYQ